MAWAATPPTSARWPTIFEAKGRPQFNPLISHVLDAGEAKRLVQWNETADRLAARFWPGPLTLVLPRAKNSPIALLATAGLDTVAIRAPAHPMAQALIRAAGRPIAAPSANRSGAVSPTRAEHVAESLGDRVTLILDGGPCDGRRWNRRCSTSRPRTPTLLRPGGATREAIEAVIGPVALSDAIPIGRRRPQVARPARQPLCAGAAGAAERHHASPPTKACSPSARDVPAGAHADAQSQPVAATSPRRPPTCSPCCARSTGRASAASRSCPFRKRDWALRSTTGCAAPPRMTARAGGGRLRQREETMPDTATPPSIPTVPVTPAVLDGLRAIVGDKGLILDDQGKQPFVRDWRGTLVGTAAVVVRPANTEEVSKVVKLCFDNGIAIVPQGGNTGLMGGATP